MENRRPAVRRLIWLLCVLGGLRVLVFAGAYPFFDFIDEALHLDTVLDFARVGGLPGPGDDRFNPDAARIIARYSVGQAAPTPAAREQAIEAEAQRLLQYRNAETFAPPLYYALAAAWYRVGQLIGLHDTALLYWLRFLSAPLFAAAVWLACRTCLDFHPNRPELAIGVGIVLVVWPQDILYSINSDVLSPAMVALALYLLVRWICADRMAKPPTGVALAAGFAASLAMLTKYTNVAELIVIPLAILIARRRHPGRVHIVEIAALLVATAVPLGLWMLRCQLTFGDWTASREKIGMLDWTVLPLAQSLHHPIFTPPGFLDFLTRLCVTFWRGELVWNNSVQRIRFVDWIYLGVSSLGLLGTLGWLLRPSPRGRLDRPLALIYFVAVAGSVLFLGLLSTRFDYGHCFFPSRGFPYFAAGRLMTGTMVPFAILLIGGTDEMLSFAKRFRVVILFASVVAIVCLASEIWLFTTTTSPREIGVFQSPNNAYHLLGRRAN